jgi:hypothetical protein
MAEIFLERSFETPLTASYVLAMAQQAGGCYDLHRIEWHGSLLAAGGRKLLCRFRAPDAESVRLALRDLRSGFGRLWTGSVHDAPGFAETDQQKANVLIERTFDPPVAESEIHKAEKDGWCAQAHRVTFMRTYVSDDRRRMICLYQAPDAESVRLAQRLMTMPVDAIWAFTAIRPEAPDRG